MIFDKKDGALEKVKEYREQGIIDFIGLTGAHSPIDGKWHINPKREIKVMSEAIKTGEFDTVMLSYHIEYQTEEIEGLIDLAGQYDVGVICKKPLGAGKLINKYGAKNLLKFVLDNPGVHTTISGITSREEVREDGSVGFDVSGV